MQDGAGARRVCVSSPCRLCLLKRCVCGWMQAVFAWGVRAHTRVDKFVGLQTACSPVMCGFAACLQALSVCEFWGLRALRMCVHAGLRAVPVCWVFVLRVCVSLHTWGGAAGGVSVSVERVLCAGPWVCRLHGGLCAQICRLCRVCVRVGVLQAACVLRVCVHAGDYRRRVCVWGARAPHVPREWGAAGWGCSLQSACVYVYVRARWVPQPRGYPRPGSLEPHGG